MILVYMNGSKEAQHNSQDVQKNSKMVHVKKHQGGVIIEKVSPTSASNMMNYLKHQVDMFSRSLAIGVFRCGMVEEIGANRLYMILNIYIYTHTRTPSGLKVIHQTWLAGKRTIHR